MSLEDKSWKGSCLRNQPCTSSSRAKELSISGTLDVEYLKEHLNLLKLQVHFRHIIKRRIDAFSDNFLT